MAGMVARVWLGLAVVSLGLGCGETDEARPDAGAAVGRATDGAAPGPSDAGREAPEADAGPQRDLGGAAGDTGDTAAPADFPVEIGAGDRAYRPLAEDGESTLHRGCQGAQHLWVSLRVPGTLPEPSALLLTLSAPGDQAVRLAPPVYLVDEPWHRAGEDWEIVGLTLVVFDPDPVIDQRAELYATVTLPDARRGEGRRNIRVAWGDDECGR